MIAMNSNQIQNWLDTADPSITEIITVYVQALDEFKEVSKVLKKLNLAIETKIEEQENTKTKTIYTY